MGRDTFENLETSLSRYGRFEWTNIVGSGRQLLTPNFPGTKMFGTCDVSSGSPTITNFKKADASSLRLRDRFLNEQMKITVEDGSGLFHTRLVTSIGASSLAAGADFAVTGTDLRFWMYPAADEYQYVVTAVQVLSETEATYTFRDESHILFGAGDDFSGELGTPGACGNMVNLGANGGLASRIPFPITPGDRLYLEADVPATGSIVIWYKETKSRYFDVASAPSLTTTTSSSTTSTTSTSSSTTSVPPTTSTSSSTTSTTTVPATTSTSTSSSTTSTTAPATTTSTVPPTTTTTVP